MIIKKLNTESDGTRSFELSSNQISHHALLRMIKRIPEAKVKHAAHDPMNDNSAIEVVYKGENILIETPFSDYIINCSSHSDIFDNFVSILADYKVRWWERLI